MSISIGIGGKSYEYIPVKDSNNFMVLKSEPSFNEIGEGELLGISVNFFGNRLDIKNSFNLSKKDSITDLTLYFGLISLINSSVYTFEILLFWVVLWSLHVNVLSVNKNIELDNFIKSNKTIVNNVQRSVEKFRYLLLGENSGRVFYIYLIFNGDKVVLPLLVSVDSVFRDYMRRRINMLIGKFRGILMGNRVNILEVKNLLMGYFRGGGNRLGNEIDNRLRNYGLENNVMLKPNKFPVSGINNPKNNICYANSLMHMLYHLTNFRNFLLKNFHEMGGLGVINDIYGLFVKLGSSTSQYIDCSEINKIKDLILSNKERDKWQDPADFLNKLFNYISGNTNHFIKNLLNFILIGYKGGRNDYIMGLNSYDGNSIQEIINKNVVDVVKFGGYLLINLYRGDLREVIINREITINKMGRYILDGVIIYISAHYIYISCNEGGEFDYFYDDKNVRKYANINKRVFDVNKIAVIIAYRKI